MNVQTSELGGLRCHVVDALPAGQSPSLGVILCHGFGAPGSDLVSLGPELLRLEPALSESVQFLFPEGPLSLDEMGMYGGRAWWLLDVERLAARLEGGEQPGPPDQGHRPRVGPVGARPCPLRDVAPELPDARERLLSVTADFCETSGLGSGRIVFGGFSQGAMLATDVALRLPERPAGLCIFSGTLLYPEEWRDLAVRRGPLPVLQSHGRQDPLLPFPAAEWLHELLTAAGLPVEFVPFDGLHTISLEAVERFAGFLARLVA